MVKVANNYKNNNIEDVCPHCRGHGDTTEHLLSCPQLTIKYDGNWRNTVNTIHWKNLAQIADMNLKLRFE